MSDEGNRNGCIPAAGTASALRLMPVDGRGETPYDGAMCLSVPGRVVEWRERESAFAQAVVEFAGVRRPVNMACVPDTEPGEYVLVHAGVAITRIDSGEAAKILADMAEIEQLLAGDVESGDTDGSP